MVIRSPRILIVDDEPHNVKLLEAHLAPKGYAVVSATDGQQALALIAQQPVDLVLLDVMMPGLDGFEVTRRLRQQEATRLLPIVLVTALKETEDRIRGLEAGCDDFIAKPYDKDEILARVKTLLQLSYYRSLLDEKEKFESVMDRIREGIVVLDKQLAVRRINRPAAEFLGIDPANPPADFVGHLGGSFRIRDDGTLQHALGHAALAFDLERPETPTTKALILGARSSIVRDPNGEISSIVLTVRDVTEERKEESLKQNFLSLISHKLHTPVAVIGLNASLLQEGVLGPLNDQQRHTLETITEAADKLGQLIDRLLEVTMIHGRTLDPATEPTVLRDYLPGVIDAVVRQAKPKQVAVQVECADPRAAVRVNKVYLDLILRNLLDNAIKFTDQDPVPITIRVTPKDHWVAVAVIDRGRGIPPEERERIFSTFYQVEKDFTGNVEGAGLGLALVQRLVTAHGGRVEAQSALGQGSTITVTLPS